MYRDGSFLNKFGVSAQLLSMSCLGLLLAGSVSGCSATTNQTQAQQKDETLKMEIVQVDQLSRLGNKTPDGQFIVAKASIKNLSNQTTTMNPPDFMLENITDNEAERYSQPAEKFLGFAFTKSYGEENKDKLVDVTPMTLYPRLQLERYFVFMVPVDAKPKNYQITYKPLQVTSPLVSGNTIINDHRNDASIPDFEQ